MQNTVSRNVPILFQSINTYESQEIDIRFQKVKIWLCHTGKNHNGSYFSREAIEDAIPSLSNTPVLAYIENNRSTGKSDFSDHREIIVRKDGEVTTKYLGKAIGIIPESNNATFEDRLCDDGETRTFLTVEALLWTKFDDSTDIMSRDLIKGQSMELSEEFEGEWGEDNCFHFTKFQFYGACGLGENVQPAMQNSTIELQFSSIEISEFSNEVNAIMETFKKNFSTKEENEQEQKENEELKTKQDIATSFNLTVSQMSDELSRKLSELKYTTKNWYDEDIEVARYRMRDFDEQNVYAVDRMNNYQDVRVPYSKNGDNVSFEFESTTKIKYVPTDWDNGVSEESEINFTNSIVDEHKNYAVQIVSELKEEISTKQNDYIELNDKFSKVQEQLSQKENEISGLNAAMEQLKEYQRNTEDKKKAEQIEVIFSKIARAFSSEELNEWREKSSSYDSVSEFERDIKSFAYDRISETNKSVKTDFSQMGTLHTESDEKPDETKNKDVWSRLKQ
ncbi:hypothetical protein [Paenibacillus sp. 1781tsa1]|uniref:hypothetical protein n=1 Tax=Paenibacillus sp. 1781tsa1 TaxID=2953810 RepID=UPI00209CB319|nr:hypothetical protein [Paenibacillus sp. 1781tsa1]MCP1185081.1 hypothetical protein [Paenibacillus sp. 1781tsa1]